MSSLPKLFNATVSLPPSFASIIIASVGSGVAWGAAVGTAVGSAAIVASGAAVAGAVVAGGVVGAGAVVGSASSPHAMASTSRASNGANSRYLPFKMVRYDKGAPPRGKYRSCLAPQDVLVNLA